jgi:archaeal ATPase
MQISRLNSSQTDILKNLSILPVSGVYKNHFRNWLQLASLHDVNYLARYGFITDDIENKKINLHPLIQEIIYEELNPCISNCQTLVNSLHSICLMHGLEVRKPDNTIQAMISVVENIINDNSACYLLFLQDMFPYLEKYSVRDYMSKLADRISCLMEQEHIDSVCDRALLLDYKAELAYMRKDYDVAVKKREKAIHLLENEDDTMNTMNQKRYINLLSNLYNNLSNVYLALKKTDKATEALHKAFEIRISYADTGIIETHDMLQQMLNLVNMLILAGDLELARLVLNQYDALVTDNEGYNTLDYGCYRLASGIIALKEGKPVEAEKNLLAAESIINAAMDTSDSDLASSDTAVSAFDNYVSKNNYLKSVYGYLNNLYARWHKPEKALEYKEKWLNTKNEQNKNITHRNA